MMSLKSDRKLYMNWLAISWFQNLFYTLDSSFKGESTHPNEISYKNFEYFFTTLEIKGLKEATIKKLYNNNFNSIP